jgi:hypothetical protein
MPICPFHNLQRLSSFTLHPSQRSSIYLSPIPLLLQPFSPLSTHPWSSPYSPLPPIVPPQFSHLFPTPSSSPLSIAASFSVLPSQSCNFSWFLILPSFHHLKVRQQQATLSSAPPSCQLEPRRRGRASPRGRRRRAGCRRWRRRPCGRGGEWWVVRGVVVASSGFGLLFWGVW